MYESISWTCVSTVTVHAQLTDYSISNQLFTDQLYVWRLWSAVLSFVRRTIDCCTNLLDVSMVHFWWDVSLHLSGCSRPQRQYCLFHSLNWGIERLCETIPDGNNIEHTSTRVQQIKNGLTKYWVFRRSVYRISVFVRSKL